MATREPTIVKRSIVDDNETKNNCISLVTNTLLLHFIIMNDLKRKVDLSIYNSIGICVLYPSLEYILYERKENEA